VLQQAAGDARGNFDTSVTQVQYPDRGEWLTGVRPENGLDHPHADAEEIERLWFELQREMTESGKVARFNTTVVNARPVRKNSVKSSASACSTSFPATSTSSTCRKPGAWSNCSASRRAAIPPGRRPRRSADGLHAFAVDPTRGQLLALLVQSPSLTERINRAGSSATRSSCWASSACWSRCGACSRYRPPGQGTQPGRNLDKPGNNPLGRVIKVAHDNPEVDVEGLELRLGEAILKETPKLTAMLPFLKIIAVVAPLLGLLGTVTGMIITFQAITLYGAGDPKLMAGGISTALVTTVLGLVVAIPMVFLHTLVQSRAGA
jgi:biopolymer transport protein ExbB